MVRHFAPDLHHTAVRLGSLRAPAAATPGMLLFSPSMPPERPCHRLRRQDPPLTYGLSLNPSLRTDESSMLWQAFDRRVQIEERSHGVKDRKWTRMAQC